MANLANTDRDPERIGMAEATASGTATETSRAHLLAGLVIAIAHGFFEVSAEGETYLCTARGRLRKPRPAISSPAPASARRSSSPVSARSLHATQRNRPEPEPIERGDAPVRIAPGDHVVIQRLGAGQGIIEEILPRRTVLSRSRSEAGSEHVMLANLDHAVLVFAVREPMPHFGMLDRYLALCEHAGVDVTICLNKVDLGVSGEIADTGALYAQLGYTVLMTSAATGAGIDALRDRLAERTSLLTGPSGVGKSSLINILLPEASQRTGEISEATGKGRHTTNGARLLSLPRGGWLADSAGLRELALWQVAPEDLPRCFVELRPYADQCAYEDCEHSPEDEGCALHGALAAGHITADRFASFERLLEEARAAQPARW